MTKKVIVKKSKVPKKSKAIKKGIHLLISLWSHCDSVVIFKAVCNVDREEAKKR